MSLELRPSCERCAAATPPDGVAFICAHECTFCGDCAETMAHVCPNCSGELVRRPRRVAAE